MTKQGDQRPGRDDLELDPETVKDLDLEEESADEVHGGKLTTLACSPAACLFTK